MNNPPNPKQRFGDLKVPLALFPNTAIVYGALAFGEGASKYNPYNWRTDPVEAMTYLHALDRHIGAWRNRQDFDPRSGFPHLGHALACVAILIDATEFGSLIDNRPPPLDFDGLLARWEKQMPKDDCQNERPDTLALYSGGPGD